MTEKLNQNELHNAFVDVRKAYRLLYQYQSRVKDLVKYIGDYYHFSYAGGWSKFSNPSPRNGKGSLDNWAWDWLNMYLYEFHFKCSYESINEIRLSVLIMSDSGYFDGNKKNKLDLKDYNSVEMSKTQLFLVASNNGWADPVVKLIIENYQQDRFIYENIESDEFNIIAKSYPLEKFINQDETDLILDDFSIYCQSKNIDLKKFSNFKK